MKKILVVLLALLAFAGVVCAQDTAAQTYTIAERTFTFYDGDIDEILDQNFPLYFMNGVNDLPYVELRSWMEAIIPIFREWRNDPKFDMMFNAEGKDAAYVRENEYHMHFDFAEKTILFDDYNAFMHNASERSLLDLLSATGFSEAGESALFQRNLEMSYDRYGDQLMLYPGKYNIDMIAQDGKYYIPLQTMSDLMISPALRAAILFNGECVMIMNKELFGTVSSGLTPLGEEYYKAATGKRSPELAKFGYNELCFVLDNLYGLKEPHDIDNFNQLFWQMGYDEEFLTTDAAAADSLLYKVIDFTLDDLHSEFIEYSYLTGAKKVDWTTGPATRKLDDAASTYYQARAAFYEEGHFDGMPNGPYEYAEVGDTAFITFDKFTSSNADVYYDAIANHEDLPGDTIGLIIYSHTRIYRQDSPIKNVVIDLSNNTGGALDAAIFLLSWILGDSSISIKDTFTGALSTATYRADVNLDRKFNNGDVVDDKNIYVLISPVSFSCGNLVPAALKASDKVTLLGRPSGGGSCIVQPLSTAWGTFFQISGSSRLSFLKNGSFYDIDTGVSPDYVISQPSKFYDREALVEYIHNIY